MGYGMLSFFMGAGLLDDPDFSNEVAKKRSVDKRGRKVDPVFFKCANFAFPTLLRALRCACSS